MNEYDKIGRRGIRNQVQLQSSQKHSVGLIFSVVVQNYAIFAINFTDDHRADVIDNCWPLLAIMSGVVSG